MAFRLLIKKRILPQYVIFTIFIMSTQFHSLAEGVSFHVKFDTFPSWVFINLISETTYENLLKYVALT